MSSFAAFIDRLGPLSETAAALNISAQAVWNMKASNSISPVHWMRLVALAQDKGIDGITVEMFCSWYASRRERPAALAS